MPEAFAVLLVFAVSVAIYVFAWVRARDPQHYRVEDEIERLRVKRVSLEERLEKAKRENWSEDMRVSLSEQLDATIREAEKLAEQRSDETA